jgi:hypothetical protein
LIACYLRDEEGGPDFVDSGAIASVTWLTFAVGPEEQWRFILELIDAAVLASDTVLQAIAAGPLEGLLGRFGSQIVDRVERRAGLDARFRRVLSGVWKHRMSDSVWARIRAIQLRVTDPLPSA